MINISRQTKRLSRRLWKTSSKEAHFYPVDRPFLKSHLPAIEQADAVAFIKHHLEAYAGLYSNQLLVCLPELWKNITVDDLVEMVEEFTNIQAYFSLIHFTYKYLQIDILPLILDNPNVSDTTKEAVKDFLRRQYNTLLLTDDDREDFEQADGLGISLEAWTYIRQRLLLDNRVTPAHQSIAALKAYLADTFGYSL